MGRSRGDEQPPDRLAAVLAELDAARRDPGWVPSEDDVVDRPRSRMRQLPGRVAATAREAGATQRGEADGTGRGGRHAAAGDGADARVRPREPLRRPAEPLFDTRVAPSRLAVIGAVGLLVLAGLVLGGRVVFARAQADPQPVASTADSAGSQGSSSTGTGASGERATGTAAAAGGGTAATSSATAASTLVVQVVGQVKSPGVVRVPGGARVLDAVQAAGGALGSADLSAINLARPVTDGEQIQVPKPGESITATPGTAAAGTGTTAAGAASATTVVDLNTADAAALDTLPGVGPVLAQRILQWRAQNGRFTSIEELGEVSGIGEKLLAQLTPLVRVG